jgi:hypothetical protein
MSRTYTANGTAITKTTEADVSTAVQLIIPDAISGQEAMRVLERLKRDVLRSEK